MGYKYRRLLLGLRLSLRPTVSVVKPLGSSSFICGLNMMDEDYDKIEEEMKRQELESRKKQDMPVSGKSVFNIKQFLNAKRDHREEEK